MLDPGLDMEGEQSFGALCAPGFPCRVAFPICSAGVQSLEEGRREEAQGSFSELTSSSYIAVTHAAPKSWRTECL